MRLAVRTIHRAGVRAGAMPATARGVHLPSAADRPLSGLFGVAKPSGPTSMDLLEQLKPLLASSSLFYPPDAPAPFSTAAKKNKRLKPWEKALLQRCGRLPPKIGQGGTLDPLAEGVLVVGIGAGTKELQQFLHCTKEYRTTGLLGTATKSYDSKDAVLKHAPYAHVTEAMLREKLPLFTGDVQQIPPLYSALRMDGKRLFEYAREGIPLPRPIEGRSVTVEELRLVEWLPGGTHAYKAPEDEVPEDEKAVLDRIRSLAGREHTFETVKIGGAEGAAEAPAPRNTSDAALATPASASDPAHLETTPCAGTDAGPAAFSLEMTVSSGTYVRSIVHDLGAACGSAAHVVRLIRTRQGAFSLGHGPAEGAVPDSHVALPGNCIPWRVFEQGLAELDASRSGDVSAIDTRDEHGLREWERSVLAHIQVV